jgi:outer membrane protein TolC
MVKNIKTALSLVIALFPALFFSQEIKQMTADEVAELAVQNHQQLKVSAQNIDIARQNTEVAKLQKLPTLRLLQVSSI